MVQVAPDMARKLGFNPNEGMNAFDWKVLGQKEARLSVPLVSRYDLRVVADALRGLATVLDIESRRNDVPERTSLQRARNETEAANLLIREHYAAVYERLGIPQPKKGGRPKAIG